MRLWVVDSGPLIFLAKIERLDLLRADNRTIMVPATVMLETQAYGNDAAAALAGAASHWLQAGRAARQRVAPEIARGLGPGEIEVLALALELGADRVVIDDLAARRAARRVGLPMVGTVGLLLAARLRGELPSLAREIAALRSHGFWISESLREAVLRRAGERT